MASTDQLPYVGYGRISRLGGREKGNNLSNEEQARMRAAIAAAHGLPLHPGTFMDEDVSGSTFDRPDWLQAIALIRAGKAAGIVAANLDRISRAETGETLAMVRDVEAVGGRIYDETGRVSVESAEDEMILTMRSAVSRQTIRKRYDGLTAAVRSAVEERGVHLAAPYGYQPGEKDRGRATPMVKNRTEAPAVALMFRRRVAGWSWQRIADLLNETGPQPRPYIRDGVLKQGRWRPQSIQKMVTNEVYRGVAYNGQHRLEGAHPAIVSDDLFARANAARGTKPTGTGEGHLLSARLVRCTSCGYVMPRNTTGSGRAYYKCLGQSAAGCDAPVSIPAEELERWVTDSFKRDYLGDVYHADESNAALTAAEAEAASWRRKHKAANRLLVDAETDAEVEDAEAEVARTRAGLRAAETARDEAKMAARGADLPPWLDTDVFDAAPVSEKRRWLTTVYAFVVVRSACRWREPVADGRARLVPVDHVPLDNTSRIAAAAATVW